MSAPATGFYPTGFYPMVPAAPLTAGTVALVLPTGIIGQADQGVVVLLGGAAPTTSVAVALTASGATVPASVTIPAGAYSASFPLTPTAANYIVSASASGLVGAGAVSAVATAPPTPVLPLVVGSANDPQADDPVIHPNPSETVWYRPAGGPATRLAMVAGRDLVLNTTLRRNGVPTPYPASANLSGVVSTWDSPPRIAFVPAVFWLDSQAATIQLHARAHQVTGLETGYYNFTLKVISAGVATVVYVGPFNLDPAEPEPPAVTP